MPSAASPTVPRQALPEAPSATQGTALGAAAGSLPLEEA